MDSELFYWGIFFLFLPIATYILTVYRTQARVAQDSRNGLPLHMCAIKTEVQRLTIKNTHRGSLKGLAIQGWLFVLFLLYPAYFQGRLDESSALAASLAWCIYLSAAAWEVGQVTGCRKALEEFSKRLVKADEQVSVSLEKAAKLPPGIFDGLAYITVTDEFSPDENKPEFTLETSQRGGYFKC